MAETLHDVGDIQICAEVLGDDDGVPLLLVMGLGAQMIAWDDEFCMMLVDRGYRVVRFDNRDVGLSTHFPDARVNVLEVMAAAAEGRHVDVPYTLSHMAADAVGLLDVLGIEAAHVAGASMGGMIAQTIAVEHPHRVLSLTSIMSTTGAPEVGQPTAEAMANLLSPPPADEDEAVALAIRGAQVFGSPDHLDAARVAEKARHAWRRAHDPAGVGRQLAAIVASGDRTDGLAGVTAPTTVVHGTVDTLVQPSGGEATAAAVPGAELVMIEGMGHDLPPAFWPVLVEAVVKATSRASA